MGWEEVAKWLGTVAGIMIGILIAQAIMGNL